MRLSGDTIIGRSEGCENMELCGYELRFELWETEGIFKNKKFWEVVTKKIFPKIYKYWSPDAGEGNCVKPKREAWVRKTEIRNLN